MIYAVSNTSIAATQTKPAKPCELCISTLRSLEMIKAVHDTVISTATRFADCSKRLSGTNVITDAWYKARCPNPACGTKYYLSSTELFAIPSDSEAVPVTQNHESNHLGVRSDSESEPKYQTTRSLECPRCHSVIQIDLTPRFELEGMENPSGKNLPAIDLVGFRESFFRNSGIVWLFRSMPWLEDLSKKVRFFYRRLMTWTVVKSIRTRMRRLSRRAAYQVIVIKISAVVTVFSIVLYFSGIETIQIRKIVRSILPAKLKAPSRDVKSLAGSEGIFTDTPSQAELCAIKWLDLTYTTIRLMDVIRDPQTAESCFVQWELHCSNELDSGLASSALIRTTSFVRNELQRVVEILQKAPTEPVELEEVQLIVLESLLDCAEAADRLADSLSVAFEAAHGSSRFEQACFDFLSESRRCYGFLRAQVPSTLIQENRVAATSFKSSLRNQFALIPPKSKLGTSEERQVKQLFIAAMSAFDAYESMVLDGSAIPPRNSIQLHSTSAKPTRPSDPRALYRELRNFKQILQKTELALNPKNQNALTEAQFESERDNRRPGLESTAGR